MATAKKKTKKKTTPFKVPKGKTQIHLLVAVDDKGDRSFIEPGEHHTMEDAITNMSYEVPDDSAERVVDIHHIVIDLKPPKPRTVPKAKKVAAKKVRDGAAEAKKAAKAKKDEEAKAAKAKKAADAKAKKAAKKSGKKASAKQEAVPKKKATKKRAAKAEAPPLDEGNRSSQDESGNWA